MDEGGCCFGSFALLAGVISWRTRIVDYSCGESAAVIFAKRWEIGERESGRAREKQSDAESVVVVLYVALVLPQVARASLGMGLSTTARGCTERQAPSAVTPRCLCAAAAVVVWTTYLYMRISRMTRQRPKRTTDNVHDPAKCTSLFLAHPPITVLFSPALRWFVGDVRVLERG